MYYNALSIPTIRIIGATPFKPNLVYSDGYCMYQNEDGGKTYSLNLNLQECFKTDSGFFKIVEKWIRKMRNMNYVYNYILLNNTVSATINVLKQNRGWQYILTIGDTTTDNPIYEYVQIAPNETEIAFIKKSIREINRFIKNGQACVRKAVII